ncbi:helix-turn-helix domain-containing protein [Bacteroidota bacterium]
METIQLTSDFPIHIDIFALFIFLGMVQGIFLSFFFLNKNNRSVKANLFLGLLLIVISLLSFDILISYTNVMFRVIYLVDATEPLNFLVGPFFYLYILAKLDESKIKKIRYHFIPSIAYLFYSILFHVQSIEAKYNSYLDQYHPDMQPIQVPGLEFQDPLLIKSFINELTILSLTVYLILSAYRIVTISRREKPDEKRKRLYSLLWFDTALITIILIVIIVVKIVFTHDLGDYIIVTVSALFIYSVSIKVIRDSIFFQNKQFDRKYSKSALDDETKDKILSKINSLFKDEKYYLSPSPSLPDMAAKIGTSTNNLSQVINEKLKLSFTDLLAEYRIEEAKQIMNKPGSTETIEGIAYMVGYNSKSSFHTAFKKITGQTPAEYKSSIKN